MVITGLTYNLKFPEPSGAHAWPARRRLIAEQLRRADADVVGTQEGHFGQLWEIAADSGRYRWVGMGRSGGGRGEYCAVFYDPAVLAALDHGHFWLSETPDVPGSVSHRGPLVMPRMATWVRFRHAAGTELVWLNTHLDHQCAAARQQGAALIVERLAVFDGLPVVVSGDFNTTPGSEPYRMLAGAGFTDTWQGPEHGTFGDWRAPAADDDRIDWILTRGPIRGAGARIGDYHDGEHWPSDHVPVRVELSTEA